MLCSLEKVRVSTMPKLHLLRDGKVLSRTDWGIESDTHEVAAVCAEGKLVAVLERKSETEFKPQVNFAPFWFQA